MSLTPRGVAAVSLSGTVTYTGTLGSVSANQLIKINVSSKATDTGPIVASALLATNGGPFTLTVPAAGKYYLWYFLDLNGDGHASVGEPFGLYMDRSTYPIDPITAPQTDISLSFDDTSLLPGIAGTVTYTGALGPVGPAHKLIVARFPHSTLAGRHQTAAVTTNGGSYNFFMITPGTYYLKAYLDLNGNHLLDPGEPFTVYNSRSAPPGDPVTASAQQVNVDFTFGDAYGVTHAPTAPPTPTPTPLLACVGDCNGDHIVTVNEILTMVSIAASNGDPAACAAGDANGDGSITVNEILEAVSNAMNGCGT